MPIFILEETDKQKKFRQDLRNYISTIQDFYIPPKEGDLVSIMTAYSNSNKNTDYKEKK